MRKLYILTFLSCFFVFTYGNTQVVFNGNGNSGFGNPIGTSSMSFSDDGTTITVNFTKGPGDFNDTMVMYIDNGTGGRTVINGDINDTADANRRAISNIGSGDITFPAGFEVTHAIAINVGFGGLWSIPSAGVVGDNGLGYIDVVGNPALTTSAAFSFSFDWVEIGLTSSDNFPFVVTYGNPYDGDPNKMFSSDEGYGTIAPGNPGLNAFSFSSVLFYPSGTLGTNDFGSDSKFIITPNPVLNSFKINRSTSELKVFELTGKLVKQFKGEFSRGAHFNISNLKKNIYLLKIKDHSGNEQVIKLVKQ